MTAIQVRPVLTSQDIDVIHHLFQQYADALGFDLAFQDFNMEMKELPGEYSPPRGRLYIAYWQEAVAGCIALRPIDPQVGEMKRMYVRPEYRGKGIGSALAQTLINDARKIGYERIRLDTVPSMKIARHIYEGLGFKEIPAYRYNPLPGAIYMELELD